jgi:hypothetical protein
MKLRMHACICSKFQNKRKPLYLGMVFDKFAPRFLSILNPSHISTATVFSHRHCIIVGLNTSVFAFG